MYAVAFGLIVTGTALGQDAVDHQGQLEQEVTEETAEKKPADKTAIEPKNVAPTVPPSDPTSESQNQTNATEKAPDIEENHGIDWGAFVSSSDTLAQWFMALTGMFALGISAWAVWLLRETLSATREAVAEAREANEAAQSSVHWLLRQDRPFVVPTNAEVVGYDTPVDGEVWRVAVHFDLLNLGKGTAIIKGYGLTHEICCDGKHGGKAPDASPDWTGFAFVRQNAVWKSPIPFIRFQIDDETRNALVRLDRSLYVYGYIRYADTFDIVRRTGFAFELIHGDGWEKVGVSLINIGPASLWYDIEEPREEDNG